MVSIYDIVPGMKIRLVSHHENTFQKKRDWLGKVVTVRNVYPSGRPWYGGTAEDNCRPCFDAVEDKEHFPWGTGWPWYENHIECIIEDPENQPIDTSAFDSLII